MTAGRGGGGRQCGWRRWLLPVPGLRPASEDDHVGACNCHLGSADWTSQGACQDEDPDLFFPVARAGPALEQTAQAKAVCARCLVRTECLSYALGTGQDSGIWGGTTGEERRALRGGHEAERRSTRTRDPGGESPNRSR